MIGQTESRAARAEDAGDLAAFIERVSARHLEDRPDAAKEAWKAKVKAAAVEQMNAILHHPQFQALEAAWRSLSMLVMRLGAEEGIEIAICDVRLDELTADPDAFAPWLAGAKKPWSSGRGATTLSGKLRTTPAAWRYWAAGRAAAGATLLAEGLPPGRREEPAWEAFAAVGRSAVDRAGAAAVPGAAAVREVHIAGRKPGVRGDAGECSLRLSVGESGVLLRLSDRTGIPFAWMGHAARHDPPHGRNAVARVSEIRVSPSANLARRCC